MQNPPHCLHLQHPPPPPQPHPQNPCPGPVIVEGSEEYEIEKIIDSKYRYRCLHYLAKFKGWPNSDNEWLPASHLTNTPDAVQDFHHTHPSTPAPHPTRHRQPL